MMSVAEGENSEDCSNTQNVAWPHQLGIVGKYSFCMLHIHTRVLSITETSVTSATARS